MKSIFGFITGAAVGAGGLFGLRKALKMLDSTEVASPVSPASPASPASSGPTTSPLKEPPAPETLTPETETVKKQISDDLEKAQAAVSNLEEPVSMVGEPPARHQEPVAATESEPEAVTPRSETAEEAVPEKVEVKPARPTPTQSRNGAKAAGSESNGAKKPARASRPPRTDDFTVILDIGPVFNQKLHDAGIRSYKDFTRLTPAQIAEKTGIPAERIERGQWLEQVRKIMTSKGKD